ncbi:MAG TPA: hypothetical protein VD999_02100 [Vitreimonas sp.]|nr:hypothetical protein [Vitreimonas sp.]
MVESIAPITIEEHRLAMANLRSVVIQSLGGVWEHPDPAVKFTLEGLATSFKSKQERLDGTDDIETVQRIIQEPMMVPLYDFRGRWRADLASATQVNRVIKSALEGIVGIYFIDNLLEVADEQDRELPYIKLRVVLKDLWVGIKSNRLITQRTPDLMTAETRLSLPRFVETFRVEAYERLRQEHKIKEVPVKADKLNNIILDPGFEGQVAVGAAASELGQVEVKNCWSIELKDTASKQQESQVSNPHFAFKVTAADQIQVVDMNSEYGTYIYPSANQMRGYFRLTPGDKHLVCEGDYVSLGWENPVVFKLERTIDSKSGKKGWIFRRQLIQV